MKGFIEVHDVYSQSPILIAVSGIVSISSGFITTVASATPVEESYEEVVRMMEESIDEGT